MICRTIIAALCAGTLLLTGSTAFAMRCDNRTVTQGDNAGRVRSLCGAPADVTTRVESRSVTVHRRLPNGALVSESVMVSVQVEVWLYDFGPRRFMRELTFEDGRLRQIRTLGYGTSRGNPAPGDD